MPRNSSGVYALPAGNPVIPDTLIESTWANTTMTDIAVALTGSLPRDGSAPMLAPLILNGNATLPLEAVPFQQVNTLFNSNSNYLPAGAIQVFAMIGVPSGWLLCDGSAVSRTTYVNLFAQIGTTYGEGNNSTTFNLPDLRGQFIRGLDQGRAIDPGRVIGSTQSGANQSHNHNVTLNDPGHAHTLIDSGHTHGITDPGHTHSPADVFLPGSGFNPAEAPYRSFGALPRAFTGISVNNAVTNATIQSRVTGATVTAVAEGTESRPTNVAMVYCIKAFGALQQDGLGTMAFQNNTDVHISGGIGIFNTLKCLTTPVLPEDVVRLQDLGGNISQIFSSDPAVITVDATIANQVTLRPQTNVPNGMVKLNASGLVPPELMSFTGLNFEGPWNASSGLLPTGTFADGDFFEITTAGTLTLNTTAGSVAQHCNVGDNIVWSVSNPTWPVTGFYYSPASVASSLPATAISNTPAGSIAATNVQAALNELDTEKAPLSNPFFTGNVVGVVASLVASSPVGNVAATTVQGAIQELDTEKVAKAGDTMTGALKTPQSQIGTSATSSRNFTLTAETADGTMKLARGNAGATTQDLITVSAANIVTGATGSVLVGNGPAFSGGAESSQSIISDTWTKININGEEFDTNNNFDSTTNYRFTPTVAGYYQFNGSAYINTTTTYALLAIYKNGSAAKYGMQVATSASAVTATINCMIYLNGTTDYVELWVAASGTTPNIFPGSTSTYFQGFLVRST